MIKLKAFQLFADLDSDMEAEFIGIKIGDLNENTIPDDLLGTGSLTSNDLFLSLGYIERVTEKQYDITFKSKDFNHYGYQFTLGFDQQAIAVDGVSPGALEGPSQNNFGIQLHNQGAMNTSWYNASGIQLSDDNALITKSISAEIDTRLSEVLNIHSTFTPAEAVNKDLEATGVTFDFFNRTSLQFELFQNTPNPFSGKTLLAFSIPESDQVKFQVFDVSGKVLPEQTQQLRRGTHQIRISKSDLGATGVGYYQVETSIDVATRKMIRIE